MQAVSGIVEGNKKRKEKGDVMRLGDAMDARTGERPLC